MGMNSTSSESFASQNQDNDISLAGLDNKGFILTTVNDVINWSSLL